MSENFFKREKLTHLIGLLGIIKGPLTDIWNVLNTTEYHKFEKHSMPNIQSDYVQIPILLLASPWVT